MCLLKKKDAAISQQRDDGPRLVGVARERAHQALQRAEEFACPPATLKFVSDSYLGRFQSDSDDGEERPRLPQDTFASFDLSTVFARHRLDHSIKNQRNSNSSRLDARVCHSRENRFGLFPSNFESVS